MFRKVLIANRGEIAVRIAQTLRAMGVRVAAVHSDPDADALHVAHADEAYGLSGSTSAETYLRGEVILDLAKRHGVDAIHPGYGFLSENVAFAQSCADAGIAFIGPSPEAIAAMGDKIVAKRTMSAAGVPVVPGWEGAIDDAAEAGGAADEIGYPVLVKAAAGGGGKGMRVVEDAGAFRAAFDAARREATAAFGDGRVFLEKYIPRARHIEFQIFGDSHGNAVHLFERECSIQRRHQKIVEEAPSPALTDALRDAMGAAAVQAAQAIGYTNAGTVEFMLDDSGAFYFLEVNTRLQVEHPVTELTTGIDLVREQVRVAAGEPLSFSRDTLAQRGHAIEVRIYAEDAARGFLPSTGAIGVWEEPGGPGVRVDSGVTAGSEVSVHYDPMLAKLIVHGRDRGEAIERTIAALDRFAVLGVTTNVEFLRAVVDHPAFRSGDLHTRFLDEHPILLDDTVPIEALAAAALAPSASPSATRGTSAVAAGPWTRLGAWRAG